MKKISAFMLFAFACNFAFAQTDENRKAAFHFSFISPVGTNGLSSAQTTNTASLNLLFGISQNEKAFTLGGLSNVILNNATGVQIAGLSNYVGNEGRGVQIGGLTNINKGTFSGFQLAGLFNTAKDVKGVQIGGLFNTAKDAKGVQIGGVFNTTKDAKGLQIGGLFNTTKDAKGFQIGGVFNTTKDVKGVQIGGLFNTTKDVKGFQLGGLFNTTKDVKGFQLGGLFNTTKDVKGFQLSGLVNVAKDVKGVQFAGLVNIAENSDVPIGLINIIKNGEMGIAITYDGIGNAMASFRSGGKYTYGILGVGYNHKIKKNGLVTEAGFGAHIPVVQWFRINNEIKATAIGCNTDYESNKTVLNAGYSLLPAFRIGRHVELFGGVSINYMETSNMSAENLFPSHSLWKGGNSAKLQQVYIGYQVGAQFIF